MNLSDNNIKFAIVGYGHIGKRHAAIIRQHPHCSLVALCDNRPPEMLGITATDTPFFNNIEALLSSGIQFDVLCVATPNGLHETHSLLGLRASKHVLVEKPMALSKAGCERMMAEARKQDRQLFCVMQNRYSPPSVWLKDLISRQLAGRVHFVQINCFWNRDDRYYLPGNWHGTRTLDGGTLFTQFSHFIDILLWIFGAIEPVQARFFNFNHQHLVEFEDSGLVQFNLAGGGAGQFNYSTAVARENLESTITVIGEKGAIKVGGQYMNEVLLCSIPGYEKPQLPDSLPPNDYGHYKGSAANHHFVFENIVDVLNGKANMTVAAEEGMQVVDTIERIYALGQQELLQNLSTSGQAAKLNLSNYF
ncbi:MAG: Gfo/Idh/MocA family oxidoreductase [Candidatus Pseudobacter hemicellulosilyticus]|uniref:Gfo/Idh/MocA family oxidoreductase n=1 Tax=Candidatus Pseudobacter hemicellulosilyticus TaxID=3121375 RepID=A0AAJ6BIF1_9BACT|nr:MAG: Gfo/Idh/MocA family oxidoreductase [Pseudobacter sp.]